MVSTIIGQYDVFPDVTGLPPVLGVLAEVYLATNSLIPPNGSGREANRIASQSRYTDSAAIFSLVFVYLLGMAAFKKLENPIALVVANAYKH